jgi:hypothetical protein
MKDHPKRLEVEQRNKQVLLSAAQKCLVDVEQRLRIGDSQEKSLQERIQLY